MKIAYVSDSIGTPGHARGIFHYSSNFIKLLSTQGHEVDVVIASPEWLPKKSLKLSHGQSEMSDVIKSAIIGDYLANSKNYRGPLDKFKNIIKSYDLKKILYEMLTLKWIKVIPHFIPFYYQKPNIVANKFNELDYVPLDYSFFKKIKNFLLFNSPYEQYAFLPSSKIDLSNYELILLDTSHYIKFKKNPKTLIVSVVHDLLPFTDFFVPSFSRKTFIKKINQTLKISDKLIFVSKFSENIFKKHVNYPKKTDIIYPVFSPNITLDELLKCTVSTEATKKTLKITTIVSDEIRKNIQGIIDAHSLLPNNYYLEIIGNIDPPKYKISSVSQTKRVKFIGYVSEAEKVHLLYTTDIFCYVSLAEGFGIPVIEGLYYTGKVVCSDIPVFREIVDKYAFFCNPTSPSDIAQSIQQASTIPKLDKATRELAVHPFSCAAQTQAVEMLLNPNALEKKL